MAEDFYALLEVPRDASQEEIRDAFREKVRVYHPDHNDDPRASAQFTALRKAHDTLGDPVERNAYDRMGHLDYVAKRLDGLPDPETWAPSEADGAGSSTSESTGPATTRPSTTSTTSTTQGSGQAPTRTDAAAGGSTGTAGGNASTDSTGGHRTASDGAGVAASHGTRQPHQSPVVSWIARHGLARRLVGWPLLWIAVLVYAAGVGAVASTSAGALSALADRTVSAGADAGALSGALEREGVPTVFDASVEVLLGGDATPLAVAGGVLFVAGAVLLPAVVALLVYLTRMSPGWQPTYLYAVAAMGPVLGLAVGAAITPSLGVELALVLVLPLLGLAVMLSSAFVRPRVVDALSG